MNLTTTKNFGCNILEMGTVPISSPFFLVAPTQNAAFRTHQQALRDTFMGLDKNGAGFSFGTGSSHCRWNLGPFLVGQWSYFRLKPSIKWKAGRSFWPISYLYHCTPSSQFGGVQLGYGRILPCAHIFAALICRGTAIHSQRAVETCWVGDGLLTPAELKEGLQKAWWSWWTSFKAWSQILDIDRRFSWHSVVMRSGLVWCSMVSVQK